MKTNTPRRDCSSHHAPFTKLMKSGSALTEVFISVSSTKHLTSDGRTGVAKSWSIASSLALRHIHSNLVQLAGHVLWMDGSRVCKQLPQKNLKQGGSAGQGGRNL